MNWSALRRFLSYPKFCYKKYFIFGRNLRGRISLRECFDPSFAQKNCQKLRIFARLGFFFNTRKYFLNVILYIDRGNDETFTFHSLVVFSYLHERIRHVTVYQTSQLEQRCNMRGSWLSDPDVCNLISVVPYVNQTRQYFQIIAVPKLVAVGQNTPLTATFTKCDINCWKR